MPLGPLIILSGPSGCGKSTLIARALTKLDRPLRLAVSATTRPPRRKEGTQEVNGVHYYFWTEEQFQRATDDDGFLEWAEVHGNYYGTLRTEVAGHLQQGTGVILDIDVQGAEQVRGRCPDHVSIFISPPSPAVLEQRLRARRTETEAQIQERLRNAKRELAESGKFHHQIINDNLDEADEELCRLIDEAFAT